VVAFLLQRLSLSCWQPMFNKGVKIKKKSKMTSCL
jgi:hypothetical protein